MRFRSASSPRCRPATGFANDNLLIAANDNRFGILSDPQLGRFLSADPTTEAPDDGQDWNRYSYVLNNPLAFTDPSGMCFLGCFWQQSWFVAVVSVAVAILAPYAIAGFSFEALGTGLAGGEAWAIGAVTVGGALSGAISAGLSGGNVLQGLLYGGLSAGLTAGLGGPLSASLGNVLGNAVLGRLIGFGFVGGMVSVAEGGNFGSGFLAGGVGSLAGSWSGGQFDPGHMLASAIVGGAASVLGGGKFLNGAITAAFAYAATAKYGEEQLASKGSLNGPEIPADQRKAIIDQAIATYRSQSGPHIITGFINDYDVYELVSDVCELRYSC